MSKDADIVISGAGLVTAAGLDRASCFEAICRGDKTIDHASAMESCPDPDPGAGQAPDLPADFSPNQPREARYLSWALRDALREAKIDQALSCPANRCGLALATTLHGMRAAGRFFRHDDPGQLATLLAGATTKAMLRDVPVLDELAMAITTCSACASGLASIALGAMMLRSGCYDLVIAGGYDTLSEYAMAGFTSLRLVSPDTQKPFANDRNGLKLAEGYGLVVLQRANELAPGVRPLAKLAGFGETSDAYHLSRPHPQGQGASAAITQALNAAHITPESLDLVIAHATATPDNDAAEFIALATALGSELPRVPVTALKSHLGHTLGGAGAVELILACEAIRRQSIPPTANVHADQLAFPGLNLITERPFKTKLRNALCLSAGFGGANVAMVIDPVEPVQTPSPARANRPSLPSREIVLTAAGLLTPPVMDDSLTSMAVGPIPTTLLDGLIDPRQARRVSDYVKITLAVITQTLKQANFTPSIDLAQAGRSAVLLATTHGSVAMSSQFYETLVREGPSLGNPLLFAEGVPNAGAAHISMALHFTGPCQTLLGTRTAGLDAVALARLGILAGRWDQVIIGAAEEHHLLVDRAYRHCRLIPPLQAPEVSPGLSNTLGQPMGDTTGFVTAAAGACVVVESLEHAKARDAKILARITDAGSITWPVDQIAIAADRVASLLSRLGCPAQFISSANATWLDRVELLGLRQALKQQRGDVANQPVTISAMYGHVGEAFSALPLCALATTAMTGQLPALRSDRLAGSKQFRAATGNEPLQVAAVLASDYSGLTTVLRLELPEA